MQLESTLSEVILELKASSSRDMKGHFFPIKWKDTFSLKKSYRRTPLIWATHMIIAYLHNFGLELRLIIKNYPAVMQ